MGQSYKNAERLVRTETAHIHAESDRAAYKEAGVEQYEFMATLEVRTCDVCGSLDGETFQSQRSESRCQLSTDTPELSVYYGRI